MTIFGRKYKTKFTPVLLLLAALTILMGVFVLSSTYSTEVLAQTPQQNTDSSSGGFVICGDQVDNPCKIDHLFIALVMIINYLIAMAGLVALLFIVIAGVQMTISRGETGLIQSKKKLGGAIFGLVLVALAFVLVNSLFSGSFALGIKDAGLILTNPKAYIQSSTAPTTKPPTTPTTKPPTTTTPPIIAPKTSPVPR